MLDRNARLGFVVTLGFATKTQHCISRAAMPNELQHHRTAVRQGAGSQTVAVGASEAFPRAPHRWVSSPHHWPRPCMATAAKGPPHPLPRWPHGGTAGDPEGGHSTGRGAPAPRLPGGQWGAELPTSSHADGYFASVPCTKPSQPPPHASSEEGAGPTTAGHPGIHHSSPGKAQTLVLGDGGSGHHGNTQPQAWRPWRDREWGRTPMAGRAGEAERPYKCGRSALTSPRCTMIKHCLPPKLSVTHFGVAGEGRQRDRGGQRL